MRAVSTRWLPSLSLSHDMITTVEVLSGLTSLGFIPAVVDGQVTLDMAAKIYGRATLTVVDDGTLGLVPESPSDLLAPYGNSLKIRRGIAYPDGTDELVALGVFRIDGADVDDGPEGQKITLDCQDRSALVIDARFESPYDVPAGTTVISAIDATLAGAGIVANASAQITSTATTPHLIGEEGGDRLQFVQDLVGSIGLRMYFDGDGNPRFVPIVSSSTPVVTIAEGDGGVLLTAGRRWERANSYNRWIVTGENTGESAPVRDVATDDNPASPTYYGGAFGRVPRFFQSSFLTTNAQALDAANALKNRDLGTTQRVRFGGYVNPALEAGDVATFVRLRSGISEDHILEQLTIPLAADQEMTGTTKATQVA